MLGDLDLVFFLRYEEVIVGKADSSNLSHMNVRITEFCTLG